MPHPGSPQLASFVDGAFCLNAGRERTVDPLVQRKLAWTAISQPYRLLTGAGNSGTLEGDSAIVAPDGRLEAEEHAIA